MALVPGVGTKSSDSIWANTIVEPPEAMERGHSWPQTTATEEQQELDEAPASPTKPKSGSSDHSVGPQTPELQCVPYVAQNTKPPDTTLARYSLDSALAASADSAKADQPKPKPPPQQIALSTSGFFLRQAKQLVQVPVFGEDYVSDQVTEVFYIGEKPPRPLRDDGVIRMPDLDHPGKFQDGFKADITGNWFHERFLRDLHADKNIVCCQRRKVTTCIANQKYTFAAEMQCCTFPLFVLRALIESYYYDTDTVLLTSADKCTESHHHDVLWGFMGHKGAGGHSQKSRRQEGFHQP